MKIQRLNQSYLHTASSFLTLKHNELKSYITLCNIFVYYFIQIQFYSNIQIDRVTKYKLHLNMYYSLYIIRV